MLHKKLLTALLLVSAINLFAQKNFIFSPEKPKPGDEIIFTYTPAGDIANTVKAVEAAVYQMGQRSRKTDDIVLEKLAGKYSGKFTIDTAMNFVYLSFSADNKFDNNFNDGYYIHVYENGKPREGSYSFLSNLYQFMGRQVGVETNNEKALAAIEKEMELYPDRKKIYSPTYANLQALIKKDDAPKIYQAEIENLIKSGLKDETDYNALEALYRYAKLPAQMQFVADAKKIKFPDGQWIVQETINKFYQEKDVEKKKTMTSEIVKNIETEEKWSSQKPNLSYLKSQVVYAYYSKKDWVNFKKAIEEAQINDKAQMASLYNEAAWEMQKTSDNLVLAEEFSKLATTYAKENWLNPTGKKPNYMTQKQWTENNKYMYAMYADTYGMVAYRQGQYKKGLPYAKEAAIVVNKGKDAEQNNTYALLAEKALPKNQYVKELEQFVVDGKSTGEIKEILKRVYVKDKKSEGEFDAYYSNLQKSAVEKMLEELRKNIINEKAPAFALVDLDGKKIALGELKGKTVIVDFWATWCGPCKASFPGMQKMVTKYKDDPNVKFVFIDTWENGENKEKTVSEFIKNNKYTFHVLMDNDSKVVADFKVEGIPTKFVIDKNGFIRFKSIGFDGSDDKLVTELTAMIDMASKEASPKAF